MYRIVGTDGRQYGPVSADQLRGWIAEGRANAQTHVLAEGATAWQPLGTFPEFAAHFRSQVPPIAPVSVSHIRSTNSFALWGMIFGILSLICCLCCCVNIPLGALGLIFSITGLLQINEQPNLYEGRGMAVAGIILSALGLLAGVMILLMQAANGNIHQHYDWHFQ